MRQKRWFSIFYMFFVTAFFSSIVIGLSQFTSARVEANETLAFEKAVLRTLPGLFDLEASGLELHKRFIEQVNVPDELSAGAYTLKRDGKIAAYAVLFSGRGFWSEVKGVIGISADKETVTAIAFYQQKETPGLGAQITTAEFREQFEGKVLSEAAKAISFKPAGAMLGQSDVHAVTGATQTSTRVEKIINDALRDWRLRLVQREM